MEYIILYGFTNRNRKYLSTQNCGQCRFLPTLVFKEQKKSKTFLCHSTCFYFILQKVIYIAGTLYMASTY